MTSPPSPHGGARLLPPDGRCPPLLTPGQLKMKENALDHGDWEGLILRSV